MQGVSPFPSLKISIFQELESFQWMLYLFKAVGWTSFIMQPSLYSVRNRVVASNLKEVSNIWEQTMDAKRDLKPFFVLLTGKRQTGEERKKGQPTQ